jgi:hypothetical protein
MAKILRIAKWKETFEKSDAKRLLSLPWISVPTSMDSNGFVSMAEDFGVDAPGIYGAWMALCEYAATCPERGVLATSRGESIPLSRVAKKADWPVEVFERLVEWASSERIGWIEVVSDDGSPRNNHVANPDDLGEIPDHKTDGQDRTRQNKTDGRTPPANVPPVRPILFAELWEEIKPKAEELHFAIDPEGRKLKRMDKELSLHFASFRTVYPELEYDWARMFTCVSTRVDSKGSINNPWAWLKSEIIRSCNTHGPGYDAMVRVIDMRRPTLPQPHPLTT